MHLRHDVLAFPLSSYFCRAVLVGFLVGQYPINATETLIRYTNLACGIEFRLPAAWSVVSTADATAEKEGYRCSLQVQPRNRQTLVIDPDDLDQSTIALQIFDEDVDIHLQQNAIFRKDHGQWRAFGQLDSEGPAGEIQGKGWWGVAGTVGIGCFDRNGNAGLCELQRAWIGNDAHQSASLVGGSLSKAVIKTILKTWRFR